MAAWNARRRNAAKKTRNRREPCPLRSRACGGPKRRNESHCSAFAKFRCEIPVNLPSKPVGDPRRERLKSGNNPAPSCVLPAQQMEAYHGFRKRCASLVDRNSAADHPAARVLLALTPPIEVRLTALRHEHPARFGGVSS